MNPQGLQQPFDVAVVVQTVLRPTLLQAVRSIFAQDLPGRVQVLIGIDRAEGDGGLIERIRSECPTHRAVTVIDPGYSTSQRHGSLYANGYGGALRTVLSYLANSRLVAYLDDDNWWAPQHLSALVAAIAGKAWAFSLRTLVDQARDEVICRDEWESLGPGRGVYVPGFGGWVDTSCLMVDKLLCHDVMPAWCLSRFAHGGGEDRMVFERLKAMPFGATGLHTVFYRTTLVAKHPYLLWKYRQAGVDLARFLAPDQIPSDSVWAECARHDREEREHAERASTVPPAPRPVAFESEPISIAYQPPRRHGGA